MDAKQEKAEKADFDLHCLLIMKQEGVTKSKALIRAWSEGRDGLSQRLGQKVLPLKTGTDK